MKRYTVILTICAIVVCVALLVGIISTNQRDTTTVETSEVVMDTTPADINNVSDFDNYYGWTVEEINSLIYNYAIMFGENVEDVAFKDMYMEDGNYYVVFTGVQKPEYTIILDSDRYLIRVES